MLYHLSFDVLEEIYEFIPRIPEIRMKGEDNTFLRICCSDTIEGALSGIPGNIDFLNSDRIYPLVKVYEFDETGLEDEFVLSPEEIKDKVPDALTTGEHWITSNIRPKSSYIINVKSMNYSKKNNAINNLKYIKLSEDELDNIGDYYSYNIEVKATDDTFNILEEHFGEGSIEDIDDLLLEANTLIEDTIGFISSDYVSNSKNIKNGFILDIDGYYIGEYRDIAFVFLESDVINEFYHFLSELIEKYKLSVKIS